ncbi:MAG TPA: hypothetical protein VHC18_05675 [Amycolatopsis sp.]|nr:hypothetical protein [Amycolatopsis sp.]
MLAGIGIVLVTATACGERPTSTPAGGGGAALPTSSAPAPTVPSMPNRPGSSQAAPAGSTLVPPAQLDVAKLPVDYPREVYVTADGRALYLRAEEGGCGHAGAELREQTSAHVVVNLVETKSNLQGQMCTMDIRYPLVSVPLAAPLDRRTIVLLAEKRGY